MLRMMIHRYWCAETWFFWSVKKQWMKRRRESALLEGWMDGGWSVMMMGKCQYNHWIFADGYRSRLKRFHVWSFPKISSGQDLPRLSLWNPKTSGYHVVAAAIVVVELRPEEQQQQLVVVLYLLCRCRGGRPADRGGGPSHTRSDVRFDR